MTLAEFKTQLAAQRSGFSGSIDAGSKLVGDEISCLVTSMPYFYNRKGKRVAVSFTLKVDEVSPEAVQRCILSASARVRKAVDRCISEV